MASPTGISRIVQIHPTRKCNLRCSHCYTVSSPEERAELDVALLTNAITTAQKNGFNVVGFSGGEPLIYKGLTKLLSAAHDCGMYTTVTTNGMLLTRSKVNSLKGQADLIAISIDGKPDSHNKIRNDPRAFSKMKNNLAYLQDAGISFGFIFTLTQHNLDELEWVVGFALEHKARLLQIHPLEDTGRAMEEMRGQAPDELESAYAFAEVARLRAAAGEYINFQLDLIDRDYVKENPHRVFADEITEELDELPFADIVSPLVIEDDGRVSPIAYGFSSQWGFGNLHQHSLQNLLDNWRREKALPFREMCRKLQDRKSVV